MALMIEVFLLLILVISCICISNGSIVESDRSTYIQIDSHLNPTLNTSYGSIQILNEISISFNLIYHGNPHSTSDTFQNIFYIESATDSNDINDNYYNNNDIFCTQYPSMWLLPTDNALYFSLLNKYCLQSSHPIIANVPYVITIQYNISNVFISVNDTIIIDDINDMNNYNHMNNQMDIINVWISNSLPHPAYVTLYNIYIKTPQMPTANTNNINFKLNVDQNDNNKHAHTIFIIEIAVLTVFCLACLGVIIASLCLLKMRQSSSKVIKKHRKSSSQIMRQPPSKKKLFDKLTQKKLKLKHKFSSQSAPIEIRKPNKNKNIKHPQSQSQQKAHKTHKKYKTYNRAFDISKIISPSSEEESEKINNRKQSKYANSNSTNIGRYYVEALRQHTRSKSEYIPKNHSNLSNLSNPNQHQIPKYDSSNASANPSSFRSAHGANSFVVTMNNNLSLPTLPQLPQEQTQIRKKQSLYSEAKERMSEQKHMDMKDITDTLDAYDLNSDEGDEIKLRRAQIQSTRAVVSALTMENVNVLAMASSPIQTNNIASMIRAAEAEAQAEAQAKTQAEVQNNNNNKNNIIIKQQAMDGLPVIQSIYDTINNDQSIPNVNDNDTSQSIKTPRIHSLNSDNSDNTSDSIEAMFVNVNHNNNNNNTVGNININKNKNENENENENKNQNVNDNQSINSMATIPPTFFTHAINDMNESTTIPPTFPFNTNDPSTIPPTFFMEDPSTIPPPFAPISNISIGPSIPSLATDITSINTSQITSESQAITDGYSTMTNVTHLTSATKRYQLNSNEYQKYYNYDQNVNMFSSLSESSEENINNLSSGDESTCITQPNTKRSSNTVSLLSMAQMNHNNINISNNYNNSSDNISCSQYTDSPNLQVSKSTTKPPELFDMKQSKHKSPTDIVILSIKKIKRVLSIGSIGKSDENMVMTPSESEFETVSYQNIDNSLNSFDIPPYVNNDGINNNERPHTQTESDRKNEESDTSVENSEYEYEWIRSALKCCDENGWEKYYKNFKKHKVNEKRLYKLDENDWRELIPAIGPRNDFKELWNIKQINADLNDE